MSTDSLLRNYPCQRARVVIGLISGTSADGIDAAAVRFPAAGDAPAVEVLKFASFAYPTKVRESVMLAASDQLSMRETAVLSNELGHLFADAALAVIPPQGCDLVASHGQTVCHLPAQGTTLQLGDPSIIAARTGVATVADFRPADMAYGGQGAPLVPLFDAYLLTHPSTFRVAVNLGGIANITVLPPGQEPRPSRISAWDTGPANCVSDALCRLSQRGDFDEGGQIAATGTVQQALLDTLLAHPYFAKAGPKSTGLEDFGEEFARGLLGLASLPDLLRTVLALSAQSLVQDLAKVSACQQPIGELVFAGGGTSNPVLMEEIRKELRSTPGLDEAVVSTFSDYGVPEDGREAAAFAFLGDRTARGLPGSVPGATGALRAAVLGKVSFPSASLADLES